MNEICDTIKSRSFVNLVGNCAINGTYANCGSSLYSGNFGNSGIFTKFDNSSIYVDPNFILTYKSDLVYSLGNEDLFRNDFESKCDCIISEEEFNLMFENEENMQTYNKRNSKQTLGPKLNLTSPAQFDYKYDSIEKDFDDVSSIKVFGNNSTNNANNIVNNTIAYSSPDDEDFASDSSNNNKSSNKKRHSHSNSQSQPHSHFSIKIDNSRNQFKFPLQLDRKIMVTQSSGNNDVQNGNNSSSLINDNFFKCCSNTKKNRKRAKMGINTSSHSRTNTGINMNFTKKSTNLSLKSIKLNDSLNKMRKKRKGTFTSTENNIMNTNSNLGVKENIQKEKKKHCKCLIF